MKRFLSAALLALTSLAFGATTTPVSLINPAGSTSGQAILSTGPSSAPAWGFVSLSGLSGTLPIANGGTGATTAAAARTNLAVMPLAGGTFTGNVIIGSSGPTLGLNDTSGTGFPTFSIQKNGVNAWALSNTSSTNFLALSRYNSSGVFVDQPISVSNVNGQVAFANSILPNFTQGIIGTNTNNSANAGSVGELLQFASTATSLTNNTNANVASGSVTAGDWDCWGVVAFKPAGTTTVSNLTEGINTTSATFGGAGTITNTSTTFITGAWQQRATAHTRLLLASTTTVYLVAQAAFGTSTMTADGNLYCRRRR
jgi:hypothetical protein